MHRTRGLLLVVVLLGFAVTGRADEGMWTYDNPPKKQLKEKYGFEPSSAWLEHVRRASVRVGDGGSGSFVSPNGLLVTNHHVGRGQIQKLSTKDNDLITNGFYAGTQDEELKCPDLELNVLVAMEDVTTAVLAAVKSGMTEKEALDARKAAIAQIVKERTEKTGLKCDVTTLYQGGEYWLHQYKKYTDVRLVFAPEGQIAFYGGDPDNFTFPRHDVDVTFFRAYEDGKPANTADYLKWKTAGAQDGELVFVSGHPGSTNRMQTLAQMEYQKNYAYPARLEALKRRLAVLRNYEARGPEQKRRAAGQIFGIENSLKASTGEFHGLLDQKLVARKAAEENEMRARVMANPEWKLAYGWAWDSVSVAIARSMSRFKESTYRSVSSSTYNFATTLVQYSREIKKPNAERLPAYQDANLQGTKFRLFSPAPVYGDLDELQLADGLAYALENLGPNDPFVVTALGGKKPDEVAQALVSGTRLADVAYRKKLFDGGEAAINASEDPMIEMARKLVPIGDEMRLWSEKNVSGTQATAGEALGKARFAVYGKSIYPDATFTLRLSYGTVKGYPMNGTIAPSKTTMYGLYDRYYSFDGKAPFQLPKRFVDRKDKVDLRTPVNFVTTNDIIGGNSGSPVVNSEGEFVGLVFDGNIESLVGRFLYSEETNRCVAVHPAVIIECLREIYDAIPLADELEASGVPAGAR